MRRTREKPFDYVASLHPSGHSPRCAWIDPCMACHERGVCTTSRMAPQEKPYSNHSRSSHPPTAFGAARLACSGGVMAVGSAQTASLKAAESPATTAPDAWFDHAVGVIMVRKTYRLPRTENRP